MTGWTVVYAERFIKRIIIYKIIVIYTHEKKCVKLLELFGIF